MAVLFFILRCMTLLAPGRDHVSLAQDVASVVLDEQPLFLDDEDRRRTAALVVAIAFRESSLRANARSAQGDYCLMQVHGRPDLEGDARACVRVAMTMLRDSMRACPAHPLAVYAEGPRGCDSARAQRISRDRMALAHRLAREVRP